MCGLVLDDPGGTLSMRIFFAHCPDLECDDQNT